MVDVKKENQYISYMMPRIPSQEVEKEEYKVKSGDNLWNLAKKELEKDGKATNQEISDYMLLIAKLNGLDSYEKMNKLSVNQSIFIPDTEKISARDYIDDFTPRGEDTVVTEKFKSLVEELTTRDDVQIEKSDVNGLYFITTPGEHGYAYRQHLLSFTVRNGKVVSVSFELNGDKRDDVARFIPLDSFSNGTRMDWDIKSDGTIVKRGAYPEVSYGKIDMTALGKQLMELLPQE